MKYDEFRQFWYFQIKTSEEEMRKIANWISENELTGHMTVAKHHPAHGDMSIKLFFQKEDHAAVFKSVWQPEQKV